MFSLRDFAEPGDRITDFTTGERYTVPYADDHDPEGRFWVHDTVVEDNPDVPMPFGEATVGIVDEHEGGVILYLHESNAPIVLDLIRRGAMYED